MNVALSICSGIYMCFPPKPSSPTTLCPFLHPVFLHHLAMCAQIGLDAGMLLESWSGPIYMETIEHVQVIFPFSPSSFPSLPPHVFMLLSYDLCQEHWCPIWEMNNWPCLEQQPVLYSRVLGNGARTSYLLWRTSQLSMPTHNQLLLTLSPRLLMHPFRSGLPWPTPSVPIYSHEKWSC